MSTLGALESPGGFTWVRGTSDVIGRVVAVVLPEMLPPVLGWVAQ